MTGLVSLSFATSLFAVTDGTSALKEKGRRPNILFAISDDQSYPYASAYTKCGVNTPAFDEVASMGILFNNAFVAAPQCSPSRAAILTGRNIWQIGEAGTHSSLFPKKFRVFTDLLEQSGYFIGFTGKAWAPGNWKDSGWNRNPVGPEYSSKRMQSVPAKGISKLDYFENFRDFYSEKSPDKPFFFWYGGTEPHRTYEEGSGLRSGKKLSDALVPPFLPDVDMVRSDILDYALEIEWFDSHLGKMIRFLKEKGELENTMIIVTGDNGMSFPSSKANLLDYGTHVPLAICWPEGIKGGRTVDDLVSMIDLAPTFLEIAGVKKPSGITGKSLAKVLFSDKQGYIDPSRKYVFTGRERHAHARHDNLGYPARAVRTRDYLFILNHKPDRWPAGDPVPESASAEDKKALEPGYFDIDDSPSKSYLIDNQDRWPELFAVGYSRRPSEQLYNIKNDPGCLKNLAGDPKYQAVKNELRKVLEKNLKAQGDPRMTGKGDIFDSYPRFAAMRPFPGFWEEGKYNPAFQPK